MFTDSVILNIYFVMLENLSPKIDLTFIHLKLHPHPPAQGQVQSWCKTDLELHLSLKFFSNSK